MIKEFESAKEAYNAGETYFISRSKCKWNHADRTRRVIYTEKRKYVTSQCVTCIKIATYKCESGSNFKERKSDNASKWRSENCDYQTQWRRNNRPFTNIINSIRARCKKNGTPFDIDREYLCSIIPEGGICPIIGVKMVMCRPDLPRSTWMSVDRLRPELGYIKGNIAIISVAANLIKQDQTDPEIFRRMADWIEKNIKFDS